MKTDSVLHPSSFVLSSPGLQFAFDVPGNHLHGEQIAQSAKLRVLGKLAQIGKRHALTQFVQASFRDLAVLHKIGITLKD